MKAFQFTGLTPRIRFIIVAGLTLVPLATVLILVFILGFAPVFDSMQSVMRTTMDRMVPIHRLQTDLHRAAMPPNDFLIHGGTDEREQFRVLAVRVDDSFNRVLQHLPQSGAERALVEEALAEWRQAKTEGLRILEGDRALVAMDGVMEAFDGTIYRATELLGTIHRNIHAELHAGAAEAEHRKQNGITLSLGAFIIALGLGLGGSVLLTRDRESLREHSLRDPLTGAFNRRGFEAQLKKSTRYTLNFRPPSFAMLLIDVDYFKAINDTHGHGKGDDALQGIARAVCGQLREEDFFARIGGDEFVVLLAGVTAGQLPDLAERIRRAVADSPLAEGEDGRPIHTTVTLGCALYPDHADDEQALVKAADDALYLAKEAGRNRVALYKPQGAEAQGG